ncbi:MAG: hypothetical protein V3U26_01645, partial [Dehalococcoidia bacterium]
LIEVLKEERFTEALETTLVDFERVIPPADYPADHQRLLDSLRRTIPLSRERDQVIEAEDLVSLVDINTKMDLIRSHLISQVSPSLCRVLLAGLADIGEAPPDETTGSSICDTNESLPGGEYGVQLRSIMKEFQADFGPRVTGFIPALSPEELSTTLLNVQSEIETLLAETRDKVAALTPPSELSADHDRLIQYFEDTLNVAQAITQAAKETDIQRILQVEFPRSGQVLCDALNDLSPNVEPIVGFFFPVSNPPPFCG